MTFSVVARDPASGDLGCAVQSMFLATGALVLHARVGVGAVATQALMNPTWGPRGLALLEAGATAEAALAVLVTSDDLADRRQAGLVDARGGVSAYTGAGCSPWAGEVAGEGFTCQGNMLVSGGVLEAMAEVMSRPDELPLPERLVAALAVGQSAGGDARGQQSAALLVVRPGGGYLGMSDRYVDLRVDDHRAPIAELGRLLALHRLHFERPRDEDLLPLAGPLRTEVARRLATIQTEEVDQQDAAALWSRLDRWASRENLEVRMVREGWLDPIVLRILRERSGG